MPHCGASSVRGHVHGNKPSSVPRTAREFRTPHELKAEFGTVSLLEDSHVCFNIGGNKYRLVVHVRYDLGIIFVKRVLTHEEYDALNAAGTLIERRKRR